MEPREIIAATDRAHPNWTRVEGIVMCTGCHVELADGDACFSTARKAFVEHRADTVLAALHEEGIVLCRETGEAIHHAQTGVLIGYVCPLTCSGEYLLDVPVFMPVQTPGDA